jgi:predicted hydrolase (HD superfamily)
VKSVKKKWKVPSFAAGASREEMDSTIAKLGIERSDHISNVLTAMQGIAEELGLEGTPASEE